MAQSHDDHILTYYLVTTLAWIAPRVAPLPEETYDAIKSHHPGIEAAWITLDAAATARDVAAVKIAGRNYMLAWKQALAHLK